jgi:hypothetical protein
MKTRYLLTSSSVIPAAISSRQNFLALESKSSEISSGVSGAGAGSGFGVAAAVASRGSVSDAAALRVSADASVSTSLPMTRTMVLSGNNASLGWDQAASRCWGLARFYQSLVKASRPRLLRLRPEGGVGIALRPPYQDAGDPLLRPADCRADLELREAELVLQTEGHLSRVMHVGREALAFWSDQCRDWDVWVDPPIDDILRINLKTIAEKRGERLAERPILVLPVSRYFVAVYKTCQAMVEASPNAAGA